MGERIEFIPQMNKTALGITAFAGSWSSGSFSGSIVIGSPNPANAAHIPM